MTVYLSNRDGDGKTNEEGHYKFQTFFYDGNVATPDDLQVTQNTPLGLSVLVADGMYKIDTATYSYTGWLDASEVVTISSPNPSNPRIDVIVIYVDKDEDTAPAPPNNPGVAKLMSVSGAPAGSPTVPNSSAIQSAVGAGNPYTVLARVRVGAAATQITNSDITDMRQPVKMSNYLISPSNIIQAVGPLLYPVGSIYTNAADGTNPGTLLGFGTWVQFGQGKVPVGIDSSDSDFDTVTKTGGSKSHRHKGYGDNDGFGNGDLRATVGSALGQADTINFQALSAINPNTGSEMGNGTYSVRGTGQQPNIRFSHFTKVVGYTAGQSSLQPYVVVYMWRRTA